MGFYFNITFVKKFLYGFTSAEEEEEIFSHPEVNGKLAEVWDNYMDIKNKDIAPDANKIFQVVKEKAYIPDKQIYNIENSLEPNPALWYRNSMAIAASAIIIVALSIFSFYLYNKYVSDSLVQIVSEKGQRKEFTLPDGTRVWLNADTKLSYHKQFNKQIREVNLVGEAYFSVVKDASRPFVVKTYKLSIKVLGTVFNVKSYPGENTIETTLITGLVSIQKNSDKSSVKEAPILVKPKQKATFTVGADKMLIESVNIDKTTSWRSGKLVLDNESLDGVIAKLQRWYGLKIELVGNLRQNEHYTLTVKDENIEEVLHLLQLTTPITFKVEDLDGSNKRIYESKTNNHELKE
jgi:transmembrane sensor